MFDWFFTPNNTSSKVIAITIGTIKYCYNNMFMLMFPVVRIWFIYTMQIMEHMKQTMNKPFIPKHSII